jgi:hypothetical protein
MMAVSVCCKHCKGMYGSLRGRGLCYRCHGDSVIRNQYRMVGDFKFVRRGVCESNCVPTEQPEPTRTLPGTPEKVAVLEYRAANNQVLWHPLDNLRNGD